MVAYGNLTAASDYGEATLFNTFFYSVFVHSSFLLPSTDNLPTPVVSLGDIYYRTTCLHRPCFFVKLMVLMPLVLEYCNTVLQPSANLSTTYLCSVFLNIIFRKSGAYNVIPLYPFSNQETVLQFCAIDQSLYCARYQKCWKELSIMPFTTQSLTQFGFRN